jgi:hypothetical protein
MQLARVAQGCPTRVEMAKIALLDFDLKKFQMKNAEILVDDPAELEKVRTPLNSISTNFLKSIIQTHWKYFVT